MASSTHFCYLSPGTRPSSRDMSAHAINRLINSSSSNALTHAPGRLMEVVLKCLAPEWRSMVEGNRRNITDLFQCQVLPSGLRWWWLGWPCGFPLEAKTDLHWCSSTNCYSCNFQRTSHHLWALVASSIKWKSCGSSVLELLKIKKDKACEVWSIVLCLW